MNPGLPFAPAEFLIIWKPDKPQRHPITPRDEPNPPVVCFQHLRFAVASAHVPNVAGRLGVVHRTHKAGDAWREAKEFVLLADRAGRGFHGMARSTPKQNKLSPLGTDPNGA